MCNYGNHMPAVAIQLAQIGNSRGIRIPAPLIKKYELQGGVIMEEVDGKIVLRPKAPRQAAKISWEATAKEMAAAGEDWSEWERMNDGWEGK